MSADAMVEAVRLPEPLHDDSALFPAYVDHEYNMRDQYRGSVARFQEGTADLDPPTDKEIGKTFIELAGGMNSEPPRVFQRLFCLSQVARSDSVIY